MNIDSYIKMAVQRSPQFIHGQVLYLNIVTGFHAHIKNVIFYQLHLIWDPIACEALEKKVQIQDGIYAVCQMELLISNSYRHKMNIYDDTEQHNSTLSQVIAMCLVSNFNINRSIEHYTTIPLFQFFFNLLSDTTSHLQCSNFCHHRLSIAFFF